MDTQIRTVMTGHGAMDCFSFGNEAGAVLVVLPGLSLKSVMGYADAIRNQYAVPAEDYHVYFFDRIREYPEGYDIAMMAADTLQALGEAGIGKAHIMGVSQGGMIAQVMALESPGTVSSLILCSSAARIPAASKAVFENWQALAAARETGKLSEAFGEAVYTPAFFAQYKEAILAANDGAAEQDFVNFVRSIEGTKDFDVFDRLDELQCPVFVLGAGDDRVLGAGSSEEIMEKLGCEGYIYEGYGHAAYDEAPDYLARVRAYLARAKQKEN